MNYFCPGSVNTHWRPGPVNTDLAPGPEAKQRARGWEMQIPAIKSDISRAFNFLNIPAADL